DHGGAGGPHGVPRHDLERAVPGAVALSLDAAVLPARPGPGAALDRHRAADLQPGLRRRRVRPGARALPRRGARDARGRLVVARPETGRTLDPARARVRAGAPRAARRQERAAWCIGSISSPRNRCSGARWYSLRSWNGSVRILVSHTSPVRTS